MKKYEKIRDVAMNLQNEHHYESHMKLAAATLHSLERQWPAQYWGWQYVLRTVKQLWDRHYGT